jgi:hypothetical protein
MSKAPMSQAPMSKAMYERAGAAFVGSEITASGWSPQAQSGGAVLALLGHVIEDVPTLTPMSLSRCTADIFRPVPIGVPLTVEPTIIREGKKIQVVDLRVFSADADHVRARVLRIRDADLRGLERSPQSTTDRDPSTRMPTPESLSDDVAFGHLPPFLREAMDFRRASIAEHGVNGLWTRLLAPVVENEEVRPTSRVTVPMDLVNLIGVGAGLRGFTAINPDVSAHVSRAPAGEWVALVGETIFADAVGHGVSAATMSDADGVFGVVSTSQIVERFRSD